MPRTKIQNDQSVNSAALPVTRKAAGSDNKDILSGFDTNFNSPLRLYASNPSDAKLNIESNKVTMADGTAVSSPPSQSNVPTVPLTTINFQTGATTGATFDGLTFPTTTVGQYRRLALSLKSNGEIKAQWSDASATYAGLANPGSLFPSTSVNIPIGWIDLQATGATAFKTAGSSTSIIENSVSGSPRIYNVGQGSGSGGAGTSLKPNYIGNPDAEFDVLGWTRYKDAVASAPEDGVGGSPSIQWERSTTTPIRGLSDFNFIKDADNRRGEGVAYQFTVERGDLAKQLVISFDYELLSGTFATGDLSVYIVQDPTGTPVVIQPGAYLIEAAAVGKTMSFFASFQTDSTVTNYALVFHVASASNDAYSIGFDSISVKNESVYFGSFTQIGARYSSTTGQSIANGATPTLLSFPTRESETLTNVSISPIWKFTAPVSGLYQVECAAKFASNTFTSPNDVTMQLYKKNNPHSLMDSKKVTPITTDWQSYTPTFTGLGSVTATEIQYRRVGDHLQVRGKFTPGVVTAVEARMSLPVGLSSATSKIPTIQIVGQMYAQTATNQFVLLAEPSTTYLAFGVQNATQNPLVKQLGNVVFANGVVFSFLAELPIQGWSSSVDSVSLAGSTSLSLLAGEWIDVRVAHGESTGRALTTNASENYISIQRVSGPPSVAAAENVVGMLVQGNQSGTLNNTFNKVTYDSVATDTHGGYSQGVYSVQIPGLYDIAATVSTTATYAAGEKLVASIFVDGVEAYRGQAFSASPGVQGPVGEIIATGSTTPPSGCLYADGSEVSRTTYATLFAAIGTNYGAGNGTTTFNLPNLQGVFLRGVGSQTFGSTAYTRNFNSATQSKQSDALQQHNHKVYLTSPGGSSSITRDVPNPGDASVWTTTFTRNNTATDVYAAEEVQNGSNVLKTDSVETRPANVAVAYHIRFEATPYTIPLTSSSSVNVRAVNLKAGQTIEVRSLQEGTSATFNNTQKASFSLSRVAGPFAVPSGVLRGGNLTTDVFTGDGVTKTFTLSTIPSVEANVQVYISGVYQSKNSFTIFGSTITFDEAPPVGESNIEVVSGEPLDINVPGDDTVGTDQLKDFSVTGPKLDSASVSLDKLGSDVTSLLGGVGYVSNPSAEGGVGDWTTYLNGTVVNGVNQPNVGAAFSAGTGTALWDRTSTNPLRGSWSFIFKKTASLAAGRGAYSKTFTVERGDLAKVHEISFEYECRYTGDNAPNAGDLTLWIIQDPSGTPTLIQPAGYQLTGGSNGTKVRHIATFQTDSSIRDYRLLIHLSNTNSKVYDVVFDSVAVKPVERVYGAVVTDWQNFDLNITGSTSNPTFGAITHNSAKWRRVGDSAEISVTFRAASGAVAGSGIYLFSIPASLKIDSNKIVTSFSQNDGVVGPCAVGNSVTNGVGVVKVYNDSALGLEVLNEANAKAQVSSTYYQSTSGPIVYSYTARVPIAGWGSTVELSSSTDTRVVAFSADSVTATCAGATNKSANWILPAGSISTDTHAAYSQPTGIYKIPVPGKYSIQGQVSLRGDWGNNSYLNLYIFKNGNQVGQSVCAVRGYSLLDSFFYVTGSRVVDCNAGDEISFRTDCGLIGNISAGNLFNFNIERLSGPATIAASEVVAFYYKLSSTYSYTATAAVYCDSKIFDTHNSYNIGTVAAGSSYVIPVAGFYKIKASADVTSAASGVEMYLVKNDVKYGESGWIADAGSYEWLVKCNAGDRIYFTANSYSGGMNPLYTSFSGHRVG